MFEEILDWIARLGPSPLYGVTALLACAETAVFADVIVPGEAGMAVAGAAARRADANLSLLMASGVVGAIAGDSVSYAIGRWIGLDVLQRWSFTRRHLAPAADTARNRFRKRGGTTVFVGRFIGALRAVVPLVAGASEMPYPRFLAWNGAASLVWAPVVLGLGWFAGEAVAGALDRVGWGLTALVVVVVAVLVWRRAGRRPVVGDGP